MNAVDEWFNRAFAWDSPKRLLFLLAVCPAIGLLVEAGMGLLFRWLPDDSGLVDFLFPGFSWLRYAVHTVSLMGLICVLWFSGSLHRAAAAHGVRSPARSTPRPEPTRDYRPRGADFATALPFGAACVLLVLWAVEQPMTPITLAASLAGGALLSATIVLRNTIWAPILLSLACGAAIGLFLMLFSMFMSGPQGILANWAIGTALSAAFVLPAWQAQRGSRAARLDQPIWVLMSGVLILTAGAALLLRFSDL